MALSAPLYANNSPFSQRCRMEWIPLSEERKKEMPNMRVWALKIAPANSETPTTNLLKAAIWLISPWSNLSNRFMPRPLRGSIPKKQAILVVGGLTNPLQELIKRYSTLLTEVHGYRNGTLPVTIKGKNNLPAAATATSGWGERLFRSSS